MTTFMLIDKNSNYTFGTNSRIRARLEQVRHFVKTGVWVDFEQFDFRE